MAALPEAPWYGGRRFLESALKRNAQVQEMSCELHDPSKWGLRVREVGRLWLSMGADMHAYCAEHGIDKSFTHICRSTPCTWDHAGASHRAVAFAEMQSGDVSSLEPNMHLVVQRYVKPWTSGLSVSFAVAANASFLSKYACDWRELCQLRIFISHCWKERFEMFQLTLSKMLASHDVVWICALAIDQNQDIESALGPAIEESPFTKALQKAEKVLVVMDEDVEPPRRVWCVYEADLAVRLGLDYSLALVDNTDKDAWFKVQQVLAALDVRHCSASKPDDKIKILAAIDADAVNTTVRDASAKAAAAAEVMCCATLGAIGSLKEFISDGRNLSVRDARGRTPLHVAAEVGKAEVVSFLLESNMCLEDGTYDGMLPLHFAAAGGHAAACHMLLEYRASVDVVQQHGDTPLHLAAEAASSSVASMLLDFRASLTEPNDAGLGALHRAAARATHLSMLELLLHRGGSVNGPAEDGATPLHFAAQHGHREAVGFLIRARAEVAAQADDMATPLHRAAFNGCAEIVTELLKNKASVDALEHDRWTPLHRAAFNGHPGTASLLLEALADLRCRTAGGRNDDESLPPRLTAQLSFPRHAKQKFAEVSLGFAEARRPRPASSRAAGLRGFADAPRPRPAASRAARPLGLAETLRPRPAASRVVDPLGVAETLSRRTAASRAAEPGSDGSFSARAEQRGFNALHLAAANGHAAVVEVLIYKRADPLECSEDGETALQIAERTNHADLVGHALQVSSACVIPEKCCPVEKDVAKNSRSCAVL
eukprot:TRINITY_DN8666_c0_g1_i1.p1 TRINITY_DN8666_c0_g1~~TRINITY_DN8666_c0_g1_i1.p1  ORF type:complete len:772 (+),score=124.53 TRINITY_DN8666_c0_g1_i1:220-2535(+)